MPTDQDLVFLRNEAERRIAQARSKGERPCRSDVQILLKHFTSRYNNPTKGPKA